MIVLCSSDEDYASLGAELTLNLMDKEPEVHILVAGHPEDIIQNLAESGVDDFIHMGSNVYQMLAKYQEILGVIKE